MSDKFKPRSDDTESEMYCTSGDKSRLRVLTQPQDSDMVYIQASAPHMPVSNQPRYIREYNTVSLTVSPDDAAWFALDMLVGAARVEGYDFESDITALRLKWAAQKNEKGPNT